MFIFLNCNSSTVIVDEKDHTDRDLIFKKKRQEALEKQLDSKFIRTDTSKAKYDADYKIGIIKTFISDL